MALLLGPIFTLASKLLGQGPKAESPAALSSQDQAYDCQCSKAGSEPAEPGSHSDCQQTSYDPDASFDCDSTEREPVWDDDDGTSPDPTMTQSAFLRVILRERLTLLPSLIRICAFCSALAWSGVIALAVVCTNYRPESVQELRVEVKMSIPEKPRFTIKEFWLSPGFVGGYAMIGYVLFAHPGVGCLTAALALKLEWTAVTRRKEPAGVTFKLLFGLVCVIMHSFPYVPGVILSLQARRVLPGFPEALSLRLPPVMLMYILYGLGCVGLRLLRR